MDRYPRVLIGTDGSPDATSAVQIGGRIAARTGVPLKLLSVWDKGERDADWAAAVLDEAKAAIAALGVSDLDVEPVQGSAPEVLLNRANDDPDALVVVGSAGLAKATSRLVASTSNKLTHNSDADVLFARDPAPTAWNFVALATDGSPRSLHAVRHGMRLATALGATARLITAAKTTEAGEEILAAAWHEVQPDAAGLQVDQEVLDDPQPGSAIIDAGWKYELVAIGNRGMSGPERLLGSVANKVSHGLKTNLLLVNTSRT